MKTIVGEQPSLLEGEGLIIFSDRPLGQGDIVVGLRHSSLSDPFCIHNLFKREEQCDLLMEKARAWRSCGVRVECSVLDPAFTGSSALHGGMSTELLMYFLRRLSRVRTVRYFSFTGFEKNESLLKALQRTVE